MSLLQAHDVSVEFRAKKGLLGSVPKLGEGAAQKITPIAGSVPTHVERVHGCLFHPRCPDCIPGVCDGDAPPLLAVGAGHSTACYLYGAADSDSAGAGGGDG